MGGNHEHPAAEQYGIVQQKQRWRQAGVTLGAILLSTMLSAPAGAFQGDCSQPLSTGTSPTASDCLFILKAAVRLVTCTPECICEPKGSGPITATDALFCLKKAVGQAVTLQCPCVVTTSTSSTTTTSTSSTSTSTTMPGPSNTSLSVWVKKGTSYATADMAGSWRMESITAGVGSPDWSRGAFTIESNGTMSGSVTDIDGIVNNITGATLTMSADGTFTCPLCGAAFRGALDSGKTVSVITDTWDDGTLELMLVLREGGAYSQADLTGTWQFAELDSPFPDWGRGQLTFQSDGTFSGPITDSRGVVENAAGQMTVASNGVSSCPGCGPNFQGIMDSEKTVAVASSGTGSTEQALISVLRPAGSYAQSDLTGTWHLNLIRSGANPGWARGAVAIASDGTLSGTLDTSSGTPEPASGVLTIDSSGTITHSLAPDMRCALDAGKTVMICTDSN